MSTNCLNGIAFNYKQILIDEIALNGLSGITCDQLWKHLEKRISSHVTDKMKLRFWDFITNCNCITFYEVPEPVPCIDVLDRFKIVDEVSGHLSDTEDYLDGHYEYCPIENDCGSCSNYNTRKEVSKEELKTLSYEEVTAKYNDTLVMVASMDERWKALAPHMPLTVRGQLTPIHYCILELVGKGRENGQMTVGTTNLTKIVKEPKFLFYNRKHLQSLDLIRTTCVTLKNAGKGSKSLLLRLKRFHNPGILSMPKTGVLYNVKEYLLQQPDYCEKADVVISKGLMTQHNSKRLRKTINDFVFGEKIMQADPVTKKGKVSIAVKRRFISLNSKSDESSQSEDEDNQAPLECQFKVGVDLLRQAYERLLDAGLKGLTQIELSQLLGVEFYTSRAICRIFKSRHIIREYLEDRGKQRTARFYAIAAATSEMDQKYQEEKNKLLEYVKDTISGMELLPTKEEAAEDEDEVPLKKIKLSQDAADKATTSSITDNEVMEIKVLDGLEHFNNESLLFSKKNPTLRQLKFANGLLKITREKLAISGYQTLSGLVSKETGEPPMDTKALKIFVQKLVTDGQLKLMKIRWPTNPHKYSIIICAPHIQCTDPIIKLKQREISIRAFSNNKVKKEIVEPIHRPISQYAYPRYMKVQLLHELLFKLIYCNDPNVEFHMPHGFASLVNVMPEMTIEFALGNISNTALSEVAYLKVEREHLHLKLREAPADFYQRLLRSKSLQNSIRANLKVLAMLGLIQLANPFSTATADHNSTLSSYAFYLNRRAKVLDTTGTWPREEVDKENLEKTFYFETFDDVKNYWNEVYEISTHTTINYAFRGRKTLVAPVRKADEVESHDNGEIFGDGAGPCGFDSCFYMDHSRFWKAYYIRIIKNKPVPKKAPKRKLMPEKKPKPRKKMPKVIKKKPQRPREDIHPRIKVPQRRSAEPMVKWSEWEDKILIMCKVAITILSPIAQPGCLKIRNTVAKYLLTLFDPKKVAGTCHKRTKALEQNVTLQHEKDCLINELRRRRDVIATYEGLLKRLRIKHYANMTRFANEARIPMLEVVWLVNQLLKNKSHLQTVPCIAMDIDDFYKKFQFTCPTVNNPCDIYRTDEENELLLAIAKETIMLSLMANFNVKVSAERGKKIIEILNGFPERTLRIGLDQLRKCGAVVCSNKALNFHLHRLDIQDTVHASFKISMAYQRRWINRLNTEFSDLLADELDSGLTQTQIKASPVVNCLLCEFQACGILEIISITLPVITGPSGSIIQEQQLNVLDVEMKFKLKSGMMGWKKLAEFDQLTDLLDIPFEELTTQLQREVLLEKGKDKENEEDNIVKYLKEKGEKGALFAELLDHIDENLSALTKRLEDLKSKDMIRLVGYFENRIILTEFAKAWTAKIAEKQITPMPWRTVEGGINYEIFFKWAGVIMNKVFEQPGSTIATLSTVSEYLTIRAVQDICMFLEKSQCVRLQVLRSPEIDLFSDDEPPIFSEYNQFETPENIYVFPLKDSLTKYAFVRKRLWPIEERRVPKEEDKINKSDSS